MTAPMHTAAALIRAYAVQSAQDDDGASCALISAILDSQGAEEAVRLGHALCDRYETLCDASYRIGAPDCDSGIQAIADALGYAEGRRMLAA